MHDAGTYSSRSKTVYTAVRVYNDLPEYNLYGVTDCLEVSDGLYSLVEYKPTSPQTGSYRPEDLMQVFAQKICTDYTLGCSCEGFLYYADTRRRVRLPLQEEFASYDRELRRLLAEMRKWKQKGKIPPIRKGQKCSGCSLKDICMPRHGKSKSVRDTIRECLEMTP